MARSSTNRLFYNLIFATVLLLVLTLSMPGSDSITTLALEQEVRCGSAEHFHSEECYLGEVLICQQKAHTHQENCYLVLLEDNDVNWLLQTISGMEDKSLEGVIDSALVQALTLNDSFSDSTPPLELSGDDISSLNHTIEENDIVPAVVLNEDLDTGTTLAYAPSEGNVSTLDVGDDPSTGTRAINFYILLDGRVTFVNSGTLTGGNPEYYSYSDTAAAYNDVVITSLTSGNIGSTYYFRYNTDGNTSQASDFDSDAGYSSRNSRVTFANSNNAQYTILTTRTRSGRNYVYTPVAFYTVTLDYTETGGTNAVQYVQSGLRSTLTLSDDYLWYDADGNPVTEMPSSITQTTTLYARPQAFTAFFINSSGTEIADSYSAKPVDGKLTVTLPSLAGTAYEGYYWTIQGSDGSIYYQSDGTVTVDITENTTFVAVPDAYTVTFIDENGNRSTQTVAYRQTVTFGSLPSGYAWIGSDGSKYAPGDVSTPIMADVTFTAAERTINVTYDVNFPTDAADDVDSVPTLYGTASSTATDVVAGGTSTVTRTLTSRTARKEISSSNKESQTFFFQGWTVTGTDVLIQPDSTLSWSELESYADADGNVELVGVWENGSRLNSATFFVRFDSQAVDTEGNITSQPSSNYTPEIFHTHVGGVDTSWSESEIKEAYEIADTTSDNSLGADQEIRALYGEKAEGIWLYDFPRDENVFAYLKTYLDENPGSQLTVDGEAVDPDELDDEHYAIRWYVFKLEGTSWHIDGKLVKKLGTITVDKAFLGVASAIESAEEGFHIVAQNGIKNADGTFTPYSQSEDAYRKYVLVLNQASAERLADTYSDATFLVCDSSSASHSYEWKITGVTLGEYWRITEYPTDVSGYSYYAEYSVYDTDGEFSAIAEYGTQASVVGKAFALDEDPDQGMLVDFRNYYYEEDSILLKKEDAATGQGIGGAVFELWQNGGALKFDYDASTGVYTQNPDGTTTQIETASDGYAVITGFSYLHGDSTGDGARDGDITIREIIAPSGYDQAPDVELGLDGNGNVILKDIPGIGEAEWTKYAEVPTNDVAVIKDHVSEYISVTAEKIWNTSAPADSVEIVLQANGANAASLFPGMTNVQVILSPGNNWTFTWNNLPRYANGQLVTWGVKEVVVGGMPTLSDGSSFANWIVTYSPGVGTDTDHDGKTDNWHFTVTNATRRPQLILTKVGSDGAILEGAAFSLEQVELVNGNWQAVSGAIANTMTTDARGMLTFDQLMAGSFYRLTETVTPDGYFSLMEPVVITVNGEGLVQLVQADGTLTDLNTDDLTYTGPYNIQVLNLRATPLPETGGTGTLVYAQSGWLLLLLAAALFLYKTMHRKEEMNSS